MKRVLALLFVLSLLVGVIALSACGETPVTPTEADTTAATTAATTATEAATTAEQTVATTEATTAEATTAATTEATTAADTPATPEKKSIKILAIGNSFSVDAMEYVYQIAKQVGYEEIVLGNLYIGGCSLQTHAGNLRSKTRGYTYYYNNKGAWLNKGSANITETLDSEEWDYISLQQVSGNSGMPETYEPYLTQIIEYVKEHEPQAEFFWHMTWAYPLGSDYSSFKNYGYNQSTMYNAIVSTVKEVIVPREEFSFIIPVGTAIQNVRTSYFGDNLSRDNLHLSYDVGRYIASMMWVKQISGASIDDVTYVPTSTITPRLLETIKEAVNNAYEHPFEITEASDKNVSSIDEVLASYGIDASKYTELDLGLTYKAYYNSTGGSDVISAENGSTAANLAQFACTRIFEKDDLPRGTLIVVVDGYQYRPEGWKTLTSVNSSATRPQNVLANVTAVTEEWWGDFTYRAFNVAKKGNPNLTDEEMKGLAGAFAILVPNDPTADIPTLPDENKIDVDLAKMLKDAGYDLNDYEILKYEVTFYAYYYSCSNPNIVSKAGGSTASNINQFATTSTKFTKEDIPIGSLIVIADGYQYRPEGWKDLKTQNSSAERPGNVTTPVTEVTESWWGSWTYRAFNIAKVGNPSLSDDQMKQLDGVLFILVPKK